MLILAAISLLIANIFLFFKKNSLEETIAHTKKISQKMQADIALLSTEKDKISKENEKLQADSTSYMVLTTKLEQDKDKIQKTLTDSQKTLRIKEAQIESMAKKLAAIAEKAKNKTSGEAVSEVKELEDKIKVLEKKLSNDKALYYYNLGVAYTQAKYYSAAINAYKKSLSIYPANADAHYNLALIYKNAKDDPAKAAYHYKLYLRFSPNASDKGEVETAIKNFQ